MLSDDLPWPELGNVSRGATRGNQGQKGALDAPDSQGRCLLQLRVQPGVLTVLLNRQASEWYRLLDAEVTLALKLTKTYWRKARRRQDYDAVADQDHMELHEWLQQLKDKVMSHLELLMQRGDIKGPPYIMPDNVKLTFLRKFIERQAAGIPHNPRLRKAFLENRYIPPRPTLADAESPEPSDESVVHGSDSGWGDEDPQRQPREAVPPRPAAPAVPSTSYQHASTSSPRVPSTRTLEDDIDASTRHLQAARASQRRAQTAVQEAFTAYSAALDAQHRANSEAAAAEDRRDSLMTALLQQRRQSDGYPRKFSYSSDGEISRYSQYRIDAMNNARPHTMEHVTPIRPGYAWESEERFNHPPSRPASQGGSPRTMNANPEAAGAMRTPPDRKHSRTWDTEQDSLPVEPPRKRSNHGSHTGSPALPAQPLALAGH
ncbi:hypothetical protein OF83DRAFT_1174131 [Amylostereum chailletii]|nr:hypothetical protein OF83DRAFT_1174131 [Amylostereum chailletii]